MFAADDEPSPPGQQDLGQLPSQVRGEFGSPAGQGSPDRQSVRVKRGSSGWLDRYASDLSQPTVRSAVRDLGIRVLLPTFALLLTNLAIGFGIRGPGRGWAFEGALNVSLQSGRSGPLDNLARAVSAAGNAPSNIAACFVFMAVIWLVTRRWWVAIIPGVALSIEAIVHAVTSVLVNRQRPPVEQLDAAMPTASFPSGHVGASLAQLLILLFLSHQLSNAPARVALWIGALGFVAVLGWSRLYLGMHYPSDVAVGLLNGVAAALIGWNYLRRSR